MRRLQLKRMAKHSSEDAPSSPASEPVAQRKPKLTKLTMDSLNPKQRAFIGHYVITKNATEAARLAGYAGKGAVTQGPRLYRNVRIRAEIDRRLGKQAEKLEITADRIRDNLARIANGNVADFLHILPDGSPVVDFGNKSREQMASVASVTVEEFKDGRSDKREVRRIKFSMADRVKANELLGRHFGLFAEQHEHKHTHQHTLIGMMLQEIDQEDRAGGKVIEHEPREDAA